MAAAPSASGVSSVALAAAHTEPADGVSANRAASATAAAADPFAHRPVVSHERRKSISQTRTEPPSAVQTPRLRGATRSAHTTPRLGPWNGGGAGGELIAPRTPSRSSRLVDDAAAAAACVMATGGLEGEAVDPDVDGDGIDAAGAAAVGAAASGLVTPTNDPAGGAVVVAGDASRFTFRAALPYLSLVACQLIWGINGVFGKHMLHSMSPIVLLAVRCVFGTLSMVAVVAAQPVERACARVVWANKQGEWRKLIALGLANQIGNQLCFLIALQYSSATDGALFQPVAPIVAMAIALVLKREPRSPRKILGVFICVFGSFLVIAAETLLSPSSAAATTDSGDGVTSDDGTGASGAEALPWQVRLGGICLFLVNTTFVGVYVTLQRPLLDSMTSAVCTTGSFIAGTPLLVLGAAFSVGDTDWARLPAVDWAGFVWTCSVGTCFVFLLFSWVNKAVGSTITAMGNSLAPLTGSLLGIIILGESVTWLHVLGGAFLISGMIVAVAARHKELTLEKLAAREAAAAAATAAAAAAADPTAAASDAAPASDETNAAVPSADMTIAVQPEGEPAGPAAIASGADGDFAAAAAASVELQAKIAAVKAVLLANASAADALPSVRDPLHAHIECASPPEAGCQLAPKA